MHFTNILLTLGSTLVATTSAAPLSNPTPTMHPLFTVVSRIPASTPSGVTNATAGKLPHHEHTPDCEHSYNTNHNSTTKRIHNSTAGDKGHATEGRDHDGEPKGSPSPYPGFNASSYAHPSHRNGSNTVGHSYDKKSVDPEVNVTVCLEKDCKDSELVTAKLNEAGKLLGIEAKSSKGMIRREDTGFSYEDFARRMSGARIAGGV